MTYATWRGLHFAPPRGRYASSVLHTSAASKFIPLCLGMASNYVIRFLVKILVLQALGVNVSRVRLYVNLDHLDDCCILHVHNPLVSSVKHSSNL